MNTAPTLGEGTVERARWSLRLFGGFELSELPGGERLTTLGKRERVLLAYLALSPKGSQQRRKLTMLLWGDVADETTLDNLRRCLWSLRKALGDDEHRVLASEGEDIVLDASAFEIDALAFCRLAAHSGIVELEAAANLYSGELLDGLGIESGEFESWRRAEAVRYRDQAVDVLTRLMTQLSERGETERAIATGTRILRLDPLHEEAVRRLMRLYGESGRRGAALQLYRSFADALRTELDAQPEAETHAVFAEIARGEGRTSDTAAADTNLPPHTMSMARPSDAPAGPVQLPTRSVFRLHSPLALLAGAAVVAAALLSYWQFANLGTPQRIVAERAAAGDPASAISIAVLPFLNLSGDASQEFFSDGMTEEITSALARVPTLRIVGRSSAFQFKGQNRDLRAIAQALNATHLIEGSVRKEGDHVRITAQLVRADDGLNVWIESYDRQLTSVFATQEDIARAIAGALQVPLGLGQRQSLVSNRTADIDSYQRYLRARALVRARGGASSLRDATSLLEQVVAQDSRFAPAWALLAFAYAATPGFDSAWFRGVSEELRRVANASLPRAEEAARRAIELDPNLADGYLPLALAQHVRGKLLEAEQLYSKALALDPNNPDVLHLYSQLLAKVGHLKDALTMRQLTDGYPLIVFMDTRGLIHVNRIWSFKGDAPHALERILRYCIAAPLVRGLVVMIDAVPFLSELGDKFLDHFRRQQLLLD